MTDEQQKAMVLSTKISKGDKYFPAHIVQAMLDRCDNVRDKFYIMWHIECGVRVSDICGQKKRNKSDRELGQEVQNIDWENNRIHTYDHKKNQWRYVYFPERARAMLKQWMLERQRLGIEKDRRLFPYSEKMCNRIIKRWAAAVGFQYAKVASSHWCRHTFIRLSRKAGRDIKSVQMNTGDTIKTILEWYSDLSSDDMRHELETKPLIPLL